MVRVDQPGFTRGPREKPRGRRGRVAPSPRRVPPLSFVMSTRQCHRRCSWAWRRCQEMIPARQKGDNDSRWGAQRCGGLRRSPAYSGQTSLMLLSPDPRVVAMWRELACAPSGFAEPGIALVVTDEARFIRPGWCGVVVLGDRAVVVGPAAQHRRLDRLIDATAAPLALTDPIHVEETLRSVEDSLGPADLQYGRVTSSAPSPSLRGPLEYADPLVRRLLEKLPPADVSEAGFGDDSTEAIFVAVEDEEPMAASGHRRWAGDVAHVGVVTLPAARRRGLGRRASLAAAAHATRQGLVVQWRSRWDNVASLELGRSLGLDRCGRQFSFLIAQP